MVCFPFPSDPHLRRCFADVAEQPLAMGYKVDAAGLRVETAILTGNLQGQYIYEGVMAGTLFTFGGGGFVALSVAANSTTKTPAQRRPLFLIGLGILWIGFLGSRGFMHLKLPNYLSSSAFAA